jgi:hypothetical protein
MSTIEGWIHSRTLLKVARWKQVPGLPGQEFEFRTPEDRDTFSVELQDRGSEAFLRRAIHERRWRGEGGLSLQSWWLNDCLWAIPNTLKRWYREYRLMNPVTRGGDSAIAEMTSCFDHHTADRLEVVEILADVPPADKALATMLVEGYTLADLTRESKTKSRSAIYRAKDVAAGRWPYGPPQPITRSQHNQAEGDSYGRA